ncbi:MAG: hypothetical protein LQ352_001677 [Teloschistes flavicans]|nr:MAG: hypothetical protein LQ352_001677 [Teloschistes flavicans]
MPAAIRGHIPAWRRLGLKLKYAPESAAPLPEAPSPAPALHSKRKLTDEENGIELDHAALKPTKKSKKLHGRTQTATNGTPNPEPPVPLAEVAPSKSKGHRKSVSFAPETKTEDGESAKDLYKSWLISQKRSDPSFDPSTYKQDALTLITPRSIVAPSKPNGASITSIPASTEVKQPARKKKKKKTRYKSKSTLTDASSTPSSTTTIKPFPSQFPKSTPPDPNHPALTYLTLHHNSRHDWKFSKSRDSYILRHIFSLHHIPASYDPALQDYVKGCESSTTKQRLRARAREIRCEDEQWLADGATFENGGRNHHYIVIEADVEGGGTEEEERAVEMDSPTTRKELFMRAVEQHKILLRAREDAREDREREEVWRERVQKRRRAELVLCVLGDDAKTRAARRNNVVDVADKSVTAGTAVNGTKMAAAEKRTGKRKRKRRTTGVPDDESSSSSSSSSYSSSSDEGEVDLEVNVRRESKRVRLGPLASVDRPKAVEEISSSDKESDDSEASSSSSSSSSSGEGSDSDSTSSGESG